MRVVPRYYFDYVDGDQEIHDDEGLDMASLDEARTQAVRAIGELAKGKMPDGNHRDFRLKIHEKNGPVLMVVSLSLRVQR